MLKKSKNEWIVDRRETGLNLGKTLVPKISVHTVEGRETTYDRSENEKQWDKVPLDKCSHSEKH